MACAQPAIVRPPAPQGPTGVGFKGTVVEKEAAAVLAVQPRSPRSKAAGPATPARTTARGPASRRPSCCTIPPRHRDAEDIMPELPKWELSHVGIFVTDMDRMREFYTQLLGFKVMDAGELRQGVRLTFLSK